MRRISHPIEGLSEELQGLRDDVAATIPSLRGLLHAYVFWLALAATIGLVIAAPSAIARVAAIVYGVGLCSLFGVSGTYHRYRGSARIKRWLRKADHSTIFVATAASFTPISLLTLNGGFRWFVLLGVWLGALAGVVFSVFCIDAPRWMQIVAYLLLGWFAFVAFYKLSAMLGQTQLLLLIGGGVLYSAGAIVYVTQRPNPWPLTFGFHEVFHALVIVAASMHLLAIGHIVLYSVAS